MMKKKTMALVLLLCVVMIGVASACVTYFHDLPTNGIGYWTKPKEDSVVVVANVSEHITCNNGYLHLEFDLVNTDNKVKGVELWVYFKDGSANGGQTLEEKYIYVGDMNNHETKHFAIDVLFTPASDLSRLAHEDFSIHYTK